MFKFKLPKIQVTSSFFFSHEKMKNVDDVILSKNDWNLPIVMKIYHNFVYWKIYFEKQLSQVICITLMEPYRLKNEFQHEKML